MKNSLHLASALLLACCTAPAFGQGLNPTITGDAILCPDETGTLTTGTFDSYQWYYTPYGTTDVLLIPGATSQTFAVDANTYVPSYFTVEVTEDSLTETSPQFLVDGWAFAGITVMTNGEFTIGNNGEAIICEGDTIWFELLSPFSTSITWYDNGSPIPGETAIVLEVTEAGNYTVSAAPGVCPNFINYLGVTIPVVVEDCQTAGIGEGELAKADIYPNPSTDLLTVKHRSAHMQTIAIHDQLGQLVQELTVNDLETTFSVEQLQQGTYFLTIRYANGSEVARIVVR